MKEEKNKYDKDSPKKLSPEEERMLRAQTAKAQVDRSKLPPHDTSERANTVRFLKKNIVLTVAIAAITLLLIASIVLLVLVIADKNSDAPCDDDFKVTMGEEEFTLKYKDSVVDGVFYIDIKPIAEYAELTASGSDSKIKFTGADGTYIQFENGYNFAKVNGYFVELGGVATVTKDSCIIPFSFLSKAVSKGMLIKLDSSTNEVNIQRKFYDAELTQYADIIFSHNSFNTIDNNPYSPGTSGGSGNDTQNYSYPIDISSYLSHITSKNLMLANKTTKKLGRDFVPSDLTLLNELDIEVAQGRDYYLQKDAAYALEAMMKAMRKSDPDTQNTYVTSAYRSYTYQETTFERYVTEHMDEGLSRAEAEALAATYSARPGESEHQTGLCLDFMTTSMSDLDETFENTAAFEWLSKNAHLYGFILRYPEDKVSKTGYSYEPWHYRFVGREAACEIYERGLCLEEYLSAQ